jgi:hypothetical protein
MTTTLTGGFLSTSFNWGRIKGRQNDQESERGKKSENTSPPQDLRSFHIHGYIYIYMDRDAILLLSA